MVVLPATRTRKQQFFSNDSRTEGLMRTEGLLRTEGLITYNKQSKVALPSGIFSNFIRSHDLDQIICYPRSDHLLSCTDQLVSLPAKPGLPQQKENFTHLSGIFLSNLLVIPVRFVLTLKESLVVPRKTVYLYSVICLLCHEEYHGETSRPLHDRLLEHQRAAFNPPSYPNNSVGEHYLTKHLGVEPKLKYKVLNVQNSTIRRKVSEAASILQHKPAINDKNELQYLRQFLV